MTALSLGPVALPVMPVLLVVAMLLGAWIADRQSTRAGQAAAGSALVHAVGWGLLAARLVHVGGHWGAYQAEPLAMLDLRDGGWHTGAGVGAALAWVAWRAWRRPAWRRALAAGAAAGGLLWAGGMAGLAALTPRELPGLAFTDLATGRPVALQGLASGRPMVINLWASWCGPCRREMPVLAAAQVRHPEVTFVFVNQGEDAATVRRYLQAQGLGLERVLLDPGSQLGPALGSRGLPTTVILDRQGRRVDTHLGPLSGAALAARLQGVVP